MAENARRIDTIEIGIGADLAQLRDSLRAAAQDVATWSPPRKTVHIDVIPRWGLTKSGAGASAGDPEFKRQLDTAVKRIQTQVRKIRNQVDTGLEFSATFVPVQASIDKLLTDAQGVMDEKAKAGGAIAVPVMADVESAKAIHEQLQKLVYAQGPVKVPIQWVGKWPPEGPGKGKGGGGGGGGKTGGGGGGKGGGGGGVAADAEPTTVGAVVPGAKTGGKKGGGKVVAAAPITGTPTKAGAAVAAAASPGPVVGQVVPPSELAPAAGVTQEQAQTSVLAGLTLQDLERARLVGKRKELEQKGVIFGPAMTSASAANAMRYRMLEAQGKLSGGEVFAGIDPKSVYGRNPNLFQSEVLDLIQGPGRGRRVGGPGVPVGKGKRFRTPGYEVSESGRVTGTAGRMGMIDRAPSSRRDFLNVLGLRSDPKDVSTDELRQRAFDQITQNIIQAGINEQEYLRSQGAAQATEAEDRSGPAMRQAFETQAQRLRPYRVFAASLAARGEKGELTAKDLRDINNVLSGDPSKVKITDPETGKRLSWRDPESKGANLPAILPALQAIRIAKPGQYFGSVSGKKGGQFVNPDTGETVFSADPGILALATGLRSLLGVGEGQGTVGGLREIVKTNERIVDQKQRQATRRKEVKLWRSMQGKTLPEQVEIVRGAGYNPPATEDSLPAYISGKLRDWKPKGKLALGGAWGGGPLYPRLTNSAKVKYLEDAMQSELGFDYAKFGQVRADRALEVANTAKSLAIRFPETQKRLKYFGTDGSLGSIASHRKALEGRGEEGVKPRIMDAGAYWTPVSYFSAGGRGLYKGRGSISLEDQPFRGSITLNRSLLTESDKLLDWLLSPNRRPGYHPAGTESLGGIYAHEFGHQFDFVHRGFRANTDRPVISGYGRGWPLENTADAFSAYALTGQVQPESWPDRFAAYAGENKQYRGLVLDNAYGQIMPQGDIRAHLSKEREKARRWTHEFRISEALEKVGSSGMTGLNETLGSAAGIIGPQMIGVGGQHLWEAPGPGWVIPHHLVDKIPGMRKGGKIGRAKRMRDYATGGSAMFDYGARSLRLSSSPQGAWEAMQARAATLESDLTLGDFFSSIGKVHDTQESAIEMEEFAKPMRGAHKWARGIIERATSAEASEYDDWPTTQFRKGRKGHLWIRDPHRAPLPVVKDIAAAMQEFKNPRIPQEPGFTTNEVLRRSGQRDLEALLYEGQSAGLQSISGFSSSSSPAASNRMDDYLGIGTHELGTPRMPFPKFSMKGEPVRFDPNQLGDLATEETVLQELGLRESRRSPVTKPWTAEEEGPQFGLGPISRNQLGGRVRRTKKELKRQEAIQAERERRVHQIENVPRTPYGIDVDLIGPHPSNVRLDRFGLRAGSRREQAWQNFYNEDDRAGLARVARDVVGRPLDIPYREDIESGWPEQIDLNQDQWLFNRANWSREDDVDEIKAQLSRLGSRGYVKQNQLGGQVGFRKGGGKTPDGVYLVGEGGPEMFVPQSMGWIIPKDVMDQLPKRADGGPVYPSSFNVKGVQGFQPATDVAKGSVIGGNTQRVFVVNWPPSFTMGRGGGTVGFGGGAGVGVITPREKAVAKMYATEIGKTFKDYLAGTPGPAPSPGSGGGGGGGRRRAGGGGTAPGAGDAAPGAAPLMGPEDEEMLDKLRRRVAIAREFIVESEIPGLRGTQTAKLGMATPRAFTTMIGEAGMYGIGGRGSIVQRQRAAAAMTNFAQSIETDRRQLKEQQGDIEARRKGLNTWISARRGEGVEEARLDPFIAQEKELERQSIAAGKGIEFLKIAQDDAVAGAKEMTAGIVTVSSALRAQAANTLFIMGAMTAWPVMLGAITTGFAGLSQVVSPLAERYTGFYNVANKVLGPLSDQERQMQGNTEAVIAASAAHAGMSDAMTDEMKVALKSRIENEAGAKALQEQISIIHTLVNLRKQQREGTTGPLQPAGGVPGLTRSTGGWFGTPIGATPSMMEQLSLEMTGGVNTGGINSIVDFARGGFSGISPLMMGPPSQQITNQLTSPAIGGMSPLEAAARLNPITGPAMLTGSILGIAPPLTQDTEATESFNLTVKTLNENAKKAGSSILLMKVGVDQNNAAFREASEAAMISAGASAETAKQYSDSGMALVEVTQGLQGTKYGAVGRSGALDYFSKAAEGAAKQTPEQMLSQMQRALDATIRDIDVRTNFAIQQQQPAEYALRRLAEPLVPYAEDPRLKASKQVLKGPSFDAAFKQDQKAAAKFAKQYESDVTQAQTAINAQIDKGTKLLADMGVPQKTIDRLGYVGGLITKINKDLSQRQTNIQVAEYTNQIRIANRSLKDARDMWSGIKGHVGNTYGYLEGMNIRMSRQLQLLGFELQQRQINFQLATAGFVAPGTTPEERAARIEEAKIEADYAQRQLDLQKKIASNQYRQTGIGATRSIEDLQAQLSLLSAGRELVQQTSAAQAAIEKLAEERAILLEQAQTAISGAIAKENAFFDVMKTIETELGPMLNSQVEAIAGAWSDAAQSYRTNFLKPIMNDIKTIFNYNPSGQGRVRGGSYQPNAEGFFGTVSRPTTMLMGEAGTETVAILSNPRQVLAQGLSSMESSNAPIQIVFNNPIVRSETDIDAIIRKVETALMRKSTLFGLRRN